MLTDESVSANLYIWVFVFEPIKVQHIHVVPLSFHGRGTALKSVKVYKTKEDVPDVKDIDKCGEDVHKSINRII